MEPISRRSLLRDIGASPLAGLVNATALSTSPTLAADAVTPTTPDLLRIATRLVSTPPDLEWRYFWRDDHTVLFLRQAPGQRHFLIELVDTRTGHATRPAAFNAHFSRLMPGQLMKVGVLGSNHFEDHYNPPVAALSPDGKWLLWLNSAIGQKGRWIGATLDGQSEEWEKGQDPTSEAPFLDSQPLWLQNGKQWIELVSRYANHTYSVTQANLHGIHQASVVKRFRVNGLADGLPAGVTNDGRLMIYHPAEPRVRSIEQACFSLVRLGGETATVQALTVPIPESTSANDVLLSPQGDRLAWVLDRGATGSRLYQLFASKADGTDQRLVGAAPGVSVSNRFSWPRSIRWLPNGKRVSFVFRDALWSVPVP